MSTPVYTIDVAHPPRPADRVEEALMEAWGTIRNSATLRIVKVIHGYGSTGKGGSTREVVRNWAFAHRRHFRATIHGEEYALFSRVVQDLRREVGEYADHDLTMPNPGVTIIWVK